MQDAQGNYTCSTPMAAKQAHLQRKRRSSILCALVFDPTACTALHMRVDIIEEDFGFVEGVDVFGGEYWFGES